MGEHEFVAKWILDKLPEGAEDFEIQETVDNARHAYRIMLDKMMEIKR